MSSDLTKVAIPVLRWCSRCHCSVPIGEWSFSEKYAYHKGPMRDHEISEFVEADEEGNTTCGFSEPLH